MALTHISFGILGSIGGSTDDLPTLIVDGSLVTQTLVPTGTSAQTTIVAPTNGHRPCMRVSTDTAVYVNVGANPTASASAGVMMPAGSVDHVFCNPGDKAAVVIAS